MTHLCEICIIPMCAVLREASAAMFRTFTMTDCMRDMTRPCDAWIVYTYAVLHDTSAAQFRTCTMTVCMRGMTCLRDMHHALYMTVQCWECIVSA